MNTRPYHIAVFSAVRPGLTEAEVLAREERAISTLKAAGGFTIYRAIGVFEGETERSIMVTFADADKLRLINHIGITLEQDCILHVDVNDSVELIHNGNVHTPLGSWYWSPAVPPAGTDHTYVPGLGMYFYASVSGECGSSLG